VTAKAKILLIDDDADMITATKSVLEKAGYDTVAAYQGEAGLQLARKEKPDLILLDVIMPVKDGFTAADQLKKDPQLSKIPVLMLTAYSSTGPGSSVPRGAGLGLQAEDYLEKPIKPDVLIAKVKQHLGR
jgi:two-component system alkaline phosphatase synthesis response regulator PhoP